MRIAEAISGSLGRYGPRQNDLVLSNLTAARRFRFRA
jgi:hypothetical protein